MAAGQGGRVSRYCVARLVDVAMPLLTNLAAPRRPVAASHRLPSPGRDRKPAGPETAFCQVSSAAGQVRSAGSRMRPTLGSAFASSFWSASPWRRDLARMRVLDPIGDPIGPPTPAL